MKRSVAFAVAAVMTLGLATVFVADSYGFLWFGKDKQKEYVKTSFSVAGMTCDGCESTIAAALEKIDGVKCAKVDHTTGIAEVCYEKRKAEADELGAAIVAVGYTVSGSEAGVCVAGASNGDGAGCAGKMEGAMKVDGATKMDGAGCCASGAKAASASMGSGCTASGAKQVSAEGAGCGSAKAAQHASGCTRDAGMKAASTDGNGNGAVTAGASCAHGAKAAGASGCGQGVEMAKPEKPAKGKQS